MERRVGPQSEGSNATRGRRRKSDYPGCKWIQWVIPGYSASVKDGSKARDGCWENGGVFPMHCGKSWRIRKHGGKETFVGREKSPARGFPKHPQNPHCPLRWIHSLCQTRCNNSEAARVIVLILRECLVNFSQGADPSEINNFLLYLYSSE